MTGKSFISKKLDMNAKSPPLGRIKMHTI